MRTCIIYGFLLLAFSPVISSCQGQPVPGTDHLPLVKEIVLPKVKGRIDHMDVNLKDQVVYMAALGNNTLEVIELSTGNILHSITGLDEPQGVGYIPQRQEIFIANGGTGACYFYNAKTFERTATLKLPSDADDVRYDSSDRKIYVGYGTGGIAVIDADTHQQIEDIQLPAHPEGFQLDKQLQTLYVNLPDDHCIGVVDLKEKKLVKRWNHPGLSANFPMAIDPEQHRIFAGYRHPSKMVVLDGKTGAVLATLNSVGDADDLYYDTRKRRIYISGGDGSISILQAEANEFKPIANIPTRSGARTSLLIQGLRLFVVGVRAGAGKEARLLVYKTNE